MTEGLRFEVAGVHLCLADVEDTSAAATAAAAHAAQATHRLAREVHVAGDEQDGGRQPHELVHPAHLAGVGDGHLARPHSRVNTRQQQVGVKSGWVVK